MKKWPTIIIFAILLITILVFALSFFDTFSGSSKDNEKKTNTSNRIQLTFWRNYGNAAENKAYEELVSSFEKANPHIAVNMKSILYSDYEIRLRTELAAGNPPDIMTIDSPTLALYANAGSLLSIDSFMRTEGKMEDIPVSTLKGLSYHGEIYLAPIVESSIALFYNKHLFKEAGVSFPTEDPNNPLTWDEVLEIAKKVNNPAKGIIGIDPAQGFGGGESPAYFKTPLLWQFGASVLSPDGSTASGYLDSKEAIEALRFYQNLYHKNGVAAFELPPAVFESGKLGMTVLGSWTLSDFEKNHPEFKLGEDFGITPLPKEKNQFVPNGGWALGISAKSKHPKEAWKFIKYVTGYEGMKKYVTITGDIPARYSVAEDFPKLNEYPANIFLQQAQKYSRNRPITPAYAVVSDTIKKLFEDVGIGGKDVKTSAKEAVETINTALKEIQNQ
ncbi:extracellular solute-binding protein [Neobacillus bataviensis LMG 21833]|uniref:Extracellular solute-binding protein n=1 Tax=Neobacillus bataviensis LMG 21833 TaxID=1117379 RepID=K6DB22_9BACI|nr:sugar ABC transporter substrate-binding protein [Neobacillus bataviensis]EKN69737.1 extracellular solute-binding protein [Neobacillus bataviensis LMG 21833]